MNLSLKYGAIGGVVLILYITILYFIDKTLLVEGWEKVTWVFLLVLMMVVAAQRRLQEKDAFIGFRPLLQTIFQAFFIAYTIKFFFIYILFRYGDTELLEMVKLAEIQLLLEFRNPEIPDIIFNKQLEGYGAGDFGPRILDIGCVMELAFGFILSAVAASIMRRDAPYYNEE